MGRIYTEVVGNISDAEWRSTLEEYHIERIVLDQWTAQKSRFVARSDAGVEYAVALRRNLRVEDGDILHIDNKHKSAVVVSIELSDVMLIDLNPLLGLGAEQQQVRLFELGHAIGNQHWPAVVRSGVVYVPMTVDRRVMQSVMQSHNIEPMTFRFVRGKEVISYLSPYEIRSLFGGAEQRLSHPFDGDHHHHHHL